MGSGKLLNRAIEKYGLENFEKEILHIFDNEEEMNLKEAELVVLNEQCYNLCEGGKGGFGYINKEKINLYGKNGQKGFGGENLRSRESIPEEEKQKLSKLWKNRYKNGYINPWKGKQHSEETKRKMSESSKNQIPWNKGKKHSEETKEKIRQSVKKTLKLKND